MKTLGVTGGIGSGKTTVCRLFEELGADVFYADHEAKYLMQNDASARREIIEAFGAESYDEHGRLDRTYLANQVFGDDERVARINRIVHPRVHDAFEQVRTSAAREDVQLLVYEAALIFESGGDRHLDAVAVVDAPRNVRIRRVVTRDQASREDVEARMGHQMDPAELRRRADFVIENAGDRDALRAQVERVYRDVVDSPPEEKRR